MTQRPFPASRTELVLSFPVSAQAVRTDAAVGAVVASHGSCFRKTGLMAIRSNLARWRVSLRQLRFSPAVHVWCSKPWAWMFRSRGGPGTPTQDSRWQAPGKGHPL